MVVSATFGVKNPSVPVRESGLQMYAAYMYLRGGGEICMEEGEKKRANHTQVLPQGGRIMTKRRHSHLCDQEEKVWKIPGTQITLSAHLAVPLAPFTTNRQTQPVCKLPVEIPNPTKAARLSTKTTLNDPQNWPRVYSAFPKGTLKYAITRLAGRKRMVNFVSSRVMRVRCSTSRDSFRVRREKFCSMREGVLVGL